MPDIYEETIEETEVIRQDILKAEAEQNKNLIVIQMNIDKANITQDCTIYAANGTAYSNYLIANSTSYTFFEMQNLQAEAYADVMTNLTLNRTDLLSYMEANLLKDYKTQDLIFSVQNS